MTLSDFRYFRDNPRSQDAVEALISGAPRVRCEIGRRHFEANRNGGDDHADDLNGILGADE